MASMDFTEPQQERKLESARIELQREINTRRNILKNPTIDSAQRDELVKVLNANVNTLRLEVSKIFLASENEKRGRELCKITPASQEEADSLFQVAISISEQDAHEQADAILQVNKFKNSERATEINDIARQMINNGTDSVVAYILATEILSE